MGTSATGEKPYVIHGAQDPSTTTQTRGMVRSPGIVPGANGSSKIWLGLVTAAPHEEGPPREDEPGAECNGARIQMRVRHDDQEGRG